MPHPNSKTITIFRAGSFLSRSQSKDIEEYFKDSKVSIGSYWETATSPKPGTGMTYSEIALLMPFIVEADAQDRDFRSKVNAYFTDLDIKVPYEGAILEIGLEYGGTTPSEKSMPLNISDYVRYRVAKGHPYMAQNLDQASSNPTFQYYIFDKDEVVDKNSMKQQVENQAMKNFFSIEQEPEKINQMLLLMGKDPREFEGKSADVDRYTFLQNLAKTKAKLFNDVFEQEDMTTRYWITAMLKTKVLIQLGARIQVNSGNKTLIGKSMEEAIAFFLDEDNEDTVTMLKALQQEAEKVLPKAGVRMTKLLNEK